MKNSIFKEIVNFIFVYIFSFLYFIYLLPKIIDYTNNGFACIGIWCVIVGVWGKLAGMRLSKPIIMFDDYKKENNVIIIVGSILILIGLVLYIKSYFNL